MRDIPQRLTSMDLFCGAGGLTAGLAAAGFECWLANDKWRPAEQTFRANFPGTSFLSADARDLTGSLLLAEAGLLDSPHLLVGGPPCQGFSSAGRREPNDHRNTLVSTFARLVAEVRPTFVVFENVEGFLTAESGRRVLDLLDPLLEAGYHIHLRKVNAANYGVPQLRKRVLAIGALGFDPSFPTATHSAYGAPGAYLTSTTLPPTPTLGEALADLPPASPSGPAPVSDHVAPPLTGIDLERARALRPGQTMRHLPPELQHVSYRRRAFRRVMDGTPTERRGGAPAGLRRLRLDEPSKAITGAAGNEFLHPIEDRPLTQRECARLQTFPDDFVFIGSQADKAVLIGNAVPPRFASIVGEHVLRDLFGLRLAPRSTTGKLLSFAPTMSSGMSPLLHQVVALVQRRYGPVATDGSSQARLWD